MSGKGWQGRMQMINHIGPNLFEQCLIPASYASLNTEFFLYYSQ